jgi:signal transduction histidine kinase/FixJ family two-component response regulator
MQPALTDDRPRVTPPPAAEAPRAVPESQMAALIRAFDWSSTPLGPLTQWPQSLQTIVRTMLASRFAMWMAWGPDLTFLYNDAYAAMTLGRKHPWALGKPSREVWAEIWHDIGPRIDSVIRDGRATWDEGLLLFLERNGYAEETYHTFSYSPLTDDAGTIAGHLCVVVEETDRVIDMRRLASVRLLAASLWGAPREADLLQSIERTLSGNAHDLPFTLLYLTGPDSAPPRLAAATGFARQPVTALEDEWPLAMTDGQPQPMVVDDLRRRFGELPTGFWSIPPHQALVMPIAQQGNERPAGMLIVGLNPHRPLDAGYRGFIELIARQITSALTNVRAYAEEQQRATALAELDRAKTAFFSNVSHEFRTPLTLLLGPLEEARASHAMLPAKVDAQLEVVHRNALRLLKLVNTLLDFSRIEAGRVDACYEPTNFAEYTAELASGFRAIAERGGLTLTVDAPTIPEAVYLDRDMWEKVVLNLLSNAIKHTFTGGIAVRIAPAPDAAILEVRDTGVGIAATELPHIFDRFHRVPNARSRTHEGSGIGLALVQELVRLHGGRIVVASTEDVGTTFTVSVPFGVEHLPAHQRIASDTRRGSNTHGRQLASFIDEGLRWMPDSDGSPRDAGAPPPTRAARVLLADDNADMRAYVSRLLREQGWAVEAVADGHAALTSAMAEAPDLVLSDVMMPRLDGFALLRELRARPQTAQVPVILLSARAGEEARVEAAHAGADDYVTKPFAAQELTARVGAHLTLARERARAIAAEAEARARTERLQQVSAALSAARTPAAVGDTALAAAMRAIGGTTGAISLLQPDGMTIEIAACVGFPETQQQVWRRYPNDGRSPASHAVRTREATFIHDLAECDARFPTAGVAFRALGVEAVADLPLRTGRGEAGSVFGVLSLCYQAPQAFDAEQVAFVRTLADLTGQALDRALADANERVARGEADAQRAEADRQREAAERASRAKSEFLAVMSHELRTPLNAIAGYVQLLEMGIHGTLSDPQREALSRIGRSQRHLLGLVNDVLSLARIESGHLEYTVGDVVVQDVITNLSPMIDPQMAAKQLTYSLRLGPPPIVVRVDPERLDQILLNLLSNAVKFTPVGGRIVVEVLPNPDALDTVAVRVSDSGIGIPAEHFEAIFQPFVQLQAGRTRSAQGSGLGLAIARDLARGMGGDLCVQSREGEGSTFILTLPRSPGDALPH